MSIIIVQMLCIVDATELDTPSPFPQPPKLFGGDPGYKCSGVHFASSIQELLVALIQAPMYSGTPTPNTPCYFMSHVHTVGHATEIVLKQNNE